MRIAFISDIHANREALDACIAHARRQGVDRWVFLGDLVGYGADPSYVVDKVRELAGDSGVGEGENKDALDRILRKAGVGNAAAPHGASGWTLTPDGSWTRMQPDAAGGRSEGTETSGLDKILRHARTLSTRDADEYLSQEIVQAVLRGGGRAKHSHGLLEAAYNETVVPGNERRSANFADMRDLGLDTKS